MRLATLLLFTLFCSARLKKTVGGQVRARSAFALTSLLFMCQCFLTFLTIGPTAQYSYHTFFFLNELFKFSLNNKL